MDMMKKAVIVSAVRSPIGKYGGGLSGIEPYKLGALLIKEAVDRSGVDPELIEDVVMGNLYGHHGNIARVASLEAGIPFSAGAMVLDRQCASSVQAIWEAAANIMAGNGDAYVACGLEHMTREPYQMEKLAAPYQRIGPNCLQTMVTPYTDGMDRMGITAETVATKYGLTREILDAFALRSQEKAAAAIDRGDFKEQMVPIEIKGKKGAVNVMDGDELVRKGLTMETLGKLKPAFTRDGVVTAGNSCPNADGAAALVVMSDEKARALGIKPLATVCSFAVAGLDPYIMGLGPVYAVPKALKRAGITVADLDVIELNEAFSAQAIPCMTELGLDEARVNPNGGALALGHPLGATGAILTTKLIHYMKEKNLTYGMVTMCIGGGQGAALVLRRD